MAEGTVLLVDDDEAILANLVKLFGREYNLITATSAEEAARLLHREKVDIIISDYKMPGRNGLSFLIDSKRTHPGVIRALMTAYADMNLVVRALNEGEIHRFISKPYKSFEFRAVLDDCMKLAKLAHEEECRPPREQLVLVAHDSQISLSTMQILLSPLYRVLTTSNGLDVLTLISGNPVDALVVGIGLEMMDGCTITAYLKKEKMVDFPIVIWSRDITGPLEDHLRDCGADFWIDENTPEASNRLRDYLRDQLS